MCHSWRALEHQKKEPWPHRDPAGLFFCDGNDRLRIRVGMLSVAPCAPCTWFSGLPHTTSADPKSPVPPSGALCFPRNGHLFKPFQNSGCRRRAPNERRTNRGGKDRRAPRSQSHGRGAAAIRLSSASSVGYRLPIGRRLGHHSSARSRLNGCPALAAPVRGFSFGEGWHAIDADDAGPVGGYHSGIARTQLPRDELRGGNRQMVCRPFSCSPATCGARLGADRL